MKNFIKQNNNLNSNINHRDIFEMMFLFSEFNKFISTNYSHKSDYDKIARKISNIMSDYSNDLYSKISKLDGKKENEITRYDSYSNFYCEYEKLNNTETSKNQDSQSFLPIKEMNITDNNGVNTDPCLIMHGKNLNIENNYDFFKTFSTINSLAKSGVEKDLLRCSKNSEIGLPSNFKYKANAYRDSNADYLNNNFTQNTNESNFFRSSNNYKSKEAEINLNPYFNDFKHKINNVNNNNLNSSLIEDIPLENPFDKENNKLKFNNNYENNENHNYNPNKVICNFNINNKIKSNNNNLFSINNIIKIQKFWRRWKVKKIFSSNNSSDAIEEVKKILFNNLAKDEKLKDLINTIYNALNIFDSIRTNNSKSN